MHILVTNDDGVTAPGLLALAQAVREFGQMTVLAPDRNWSASGHVKTLRRPLRVNKTKLADGTPALASDGAPSDCVALGMLGVADGKVDLVVSGINPFSNLGHDVTYSGTVTAAMEAVIGGVPGLAFSLDSQTQEFRFAGAIEVIRQVMRTVLDHGVPAGLLLNVNIPDRPYAEIEGVRITRQGQRVYRDQLLQRDDPRGEPYYWIGGEEPTGVVEDGTDFGALAAGYVSVTPLQLDLTAYRQAQTLSSWNW